MREQIENIKEKVEKELEKMQDSESFVEQITKEKRKLTKKIKQIDERYSIFKESRTDRTRRAEL